MRVYGIDIGSSYTRLLPYDLDRQRLLGVDPVATAAPRNEFAADTRDALVKDRTNAAVTIGSLVRAERLVTNGTTALDSITTVMARMRTMAAAVVTGDVIGSEMASFNTEFRLLDGQYKALVAWATEGVAALTANQTVKYGVSGISVDITYPALNTSVDFTNYNLASATGATSALTFIDSALTTVDSHRANFEASLGRVQVALGHAVSSYEQATSNLEPPKDSEEAEALATRTSGMLASYAGKMVFKATQQQLNKAKSMVSDLGYGARVW